LSGKEEVIAAMENFEQQHQKFLPKVDRRFVIDLFLRLREKPDEKPMYTIESWVEEGGDTQAIRNQVIKDRNCSPDLR